MPYPGLLAALAACSALAACDAPPARARTDAAVPDAAPAIDAMPDANSTPLPDLVPYRDRALADLAIEARTFAADACELDLDEQCIGAPGERTLLRFSVETPNLGTADLFLGPPVPGSENFEYSACHDHFHYVGYAAYELVGGDGDTVAVGRKQAFCLLDSSKFSDDPGVSDDDLYWCGYQGIQRGWSDVYHSALDCQHLDVTDVPNGTYTLRVRLNESRKLAELDYDNNVLEIPVALGSASLRTPTEPCPALDARATRTESRECGWTLAETTDCTPGAVYRVGCVENCGDGPLGACTGDPMMRICDAARSDGNCPYAAVLGTVQNNACGGTCPRIRDVLCPASGSLEIYTAPFDVGASYTCEIEISEQ